MLFIVCVASTTLLASCGETDQQIPVVQQQNGSQSTDTSDPPAEALAGDSESAVSGDSEEIVFGDRFPEVLAVEARVVKTNAWRFDVTLSSTYDTPRRYADAWRVLDTDDKELGIRILGHDHANEQPFTRSATIEVPENTSTVFIEGRDQVNGWSGQRFKFELSKN